MELLLLFITFFRIGLLAVGGGLATLPFLMEILPEQDIINMIAVSESTPGPLGINMATYVGFTELGILGGLITPLGLVAPSLIIIILVAKVLEKFKKSIIIQTMFRYLRPASTALVAFSLLTIAYTTFFKTTENLINITSVFFFLILVLAMWKIKIHPIFFIIASAIVGIVLQMGHV